MRTKAAQKHARQFLFTCWLSCIFIGSIVLPIYVVSAAHTADDNDIPTWYQGDQWTYSIDPLSFSNPNITFTGSVHNLQQIVAGIINDAYKISITGQITGDITINGMQGTLSGDITGTSYQRISDLAQETTILHSEGSIVYIIPIPYQMDLVMNSTPPLEVYDFPVNIGEQWQISCLSTTTGSFSIAGIFEQSLNASQWVEDTFQCDSQEQISVPAGNFQSYKITRPGVDVWYSSDAGNIVKSTIDENSEDGMVQATLTLQSFSRSQQPITISEDIEPSVTVPGNQVTISGQAYVTQTHIPVQDATVSILIPSLGLVWTSITNNSGYYSTVITAPTMVDDTPSGNETGSGGVIAQCTSDGLTGYQVKTLVTLFVNTPPAAPSVNGPETGKPKEPYSCTVVAVDPDGDQVSYFIDWGDNTSETWPGMYDSNITITVEHTFLYKGTYHIKVKARDTSGAESEWGYLQVKMPISASLEHHPILGILERFFEHHPHAFPILRSLLGFETITSQS